MSAICTLEGTTLDGTGEMAADVSPGTTNERPSATTSAARQCFVGGPHP